MGYAAPDWRSLATALPRRLAVRLPGVLGIPDEGWQHDASSIVERHFLDSSVWPLLGGSERAMLRSQDGPLSGLPFMALPVTPLSRFDSDMFRVLLLRRLCLALAGVSTALAITAQVARGRGCLGDVVLLESAAARVCREAGARVSTNVFLRDLDVMAVSALDARRIEVIAAGLPAFHGTQLAIDTTLISLLRADVEPHRRCSDVDGPRPRSWPSLAKPSLAKPTLASPCVRGRGTSKRAH